MNLAVVIPAYEKLADVLLCLNSLRALKSGDVSFHVQDDCSPSVNFPVAIPREIASCTRNDANRGFAGNCNLGAADAVDRSAPDVLMFVNQDVYAVTEWSQGWDAAILSSFDDAAIGIVAARLLFPTGEIQSVGGTFDALAQPVHRALGWKNPRRFDAQEDVPWATGAALAVRADLFMRMGGFDEGYRRGYFEDVAFCLRAGELGYRTRYEPTCTLVHMVGSTGSSPYFQQNARRFKQQWVDSGKVKPTSLQPTVRFW